MVYVGGLSLDEAAERAALLVELSGGDGSDFLPRNMDPDAKNGGRKMYAVLAGRWPSSLLSADNKPLGSQMNGWIGSQQRAPIRKVFDDWAVDRDGNGPIRIFPSGFKAGYTSFAHQLQTSYRPDICMRACLQGVQPLCKEYVSAFHNCSVRAR